MKLSNCMVHSAMTVHEAALTFAINEECAVAGQVPLHQSFFIFSAVKSRKPHHINMINSFEFLARHTYRVERENQITVLG